MDRLDMQFMEEDQPRVRAERLNRVVEYLSDLVNELEERNQDLLDRVEALETP